MEGKYSHLYKQVEYIPPSVQRKMEEAIPGASKTFGEVRINGNHSIEAATGQADMNYLLTKKLRNKDLYRRMKDKAVYSSQSSIMSHSALNTLI